MRSSLYTDRQADTETDILNITNEGFQTIRKVIHTDNLKINKAHQDAIVRSDVEKCLDIPAKELSDDFCKGYAIAEILITQGLHNYFEEEYFINPGDLDIVFSVRNNKPYMDISLEEFVGGDGGETLTEETAKLPENVEPIRANS